jgi:hypothetical protein
MQLAGHQQPNQPLGVALIGLDPIARATRDQPRRAHQTVQRAAASRRASASPVGPASYVARTGPGRAATNAAARDRHRRTAAQLAVGADRAPADVSARHRHPLRGRVVRGDRRLCPLPAPGAADELPWGHAVRALLRQPTPSRAPSPAASTPAGCWSRPPGTTDARPASAPTCAAASRRGPQDPRARLEGPAAPAPRLAADGAPRQASHDHRRRRRARARRFCWAVATSD